MKSLERRFIKIKNKHPYWGDLTCFNEAIIGQKFKSSIMRVWFNKLVKKDDYSKSDKKEIFGQLDKLTNTPEDDKK